MQYIANINVSEYFTYEGEVEPDHPAYGMYVEGLAMLSALAEDARKIGEVRVNVDRNNDDFCNYEIPIAPVGSCREGLIHAQEIALSRAETVVLSDPPAIRLTADKLFMFEHWTRLKVKTPFTLENRVWPRTRVPAVIKQRWGCGSTNMLKVETNSQWLAVTHPEYDLVQDYIPGRAASVAFLAGNCELIPLLPTWQILSTDGNFKYQGGQISIPADLKERAVRLGARALNGIRWLKGYVGVDLILGDATDGSQDYAIEINPRLTTSYVGLRALADFNIVQAMIDVVEGRPVDYIRWKPGRVRFWPDGRVEHDPTPGAFFE